MKIEKETVEELRDVVKAIDFYRDKGPAEDTARFNALSFKFNNALKVIEAKFDKRTEAVTNENKRWRKK